MALAAVLEPLKVACRRSMVLAASRDRGFAVETFSSADRLKERTLHDLAGACPEGRRPVIMINGLAIDDAMTGSLHDLRLMGSGSILSVIGETGNPLSLRRPFESGATEVPPCDMDYDACVPRQPGQR